MPNLNKPEPRLTLALGHAEDQSLQDGGEHVVADQNIDEQHR